MPNRRQFLETLGATGGLFAAGASVRGETASAPATPIPTSLRIALMQAAAAGTDQLRNYAKADAMCRQAAAKKADLLVMPEMWNIGYRGFNTFDEATKRDWSSQALDTQGKWVGRFRDLVRELNLAIAVTYLQKWPGGPRNAVSLIDRHGQIVLTYGKVHTCDFAFEAALTPGDGWNAVDLDTAKGGVRVGAMICFDREFPESARSLMLAGAEVVVTPNACLLDDLRLAQFQVRAFENAMAVAMANYAAPMLNGRSVAYDVTGERLVEAGEQERLALADVDLPSLRFYRKQTIWGDAWRRPNCYGPLTEPAAIPTFQRKDAYGHPFDPQQG